jgi:hypothetical protein
VYDILLGSWHTRVHFWPQATDMNDSISVDTIMAYRQQAWPKHLKGVMKK